jgi:hypothetical protein
MIVLQESQACVVYVWEYLEKQIGPGFTVFGQKFRYLISNFGTVDRKEEYKLKNK